MPDFRESPKPKRIPLKEYELGVGGEYEAKVGKNLTRVRIESWSREYGADGKRRQEIHVRNLSTGRPAKFRSVAKFRKCLKRPPSLKFVVTPEKEEPKHLKRERIVLDGVYEMEVNRRPTVVWLEARGNDRKGDFWLVLDLRSKRRLTIRNHERFLGFWTPEIPFDLPPGTTREMFIRKQIPTSAPDPDSISSRLSRKK